MAKNDDTAQRSSLEEKIAARSGRIQLLVAAVARMARASENSVVAENAVDELWSLSCAYGPVWLDETANLLKEMYNRREGP